MAPQFVHPYRKGGKNDGNDAEAIWEALSRPNMRFVAVKSLEQQTVLTLHRARELLVQERTALVNQIRGLLAEYGVVLKLGVAAVRRGVREVLEAEGNGLPSLARETFAELHERLLELDGRVTLYDRRIAVLAEEMEAAKRLMQMSGIGPVMATALVASVGDGRHFANGRQFAVWLGLVPRQHSSGGKIRHGRITKGGSGICTLCWYMVPGPGCAKAAGARMGPAAGPERCGRGADSTKRRWRLLPGTRPWFGRCLRGEDYRPLPEALNA